MKTLIFSMLLLSVACSKQNHDSSSTSSDPLADSIQSAVNGVSGASDDASNEPVVAAQGFNPLKLLINDAYAGACSRILQNQGGGNCVRDVNCEVGQFNWTGTVELSYANGSSCSFSGIGDYFIRTVNFTRSAPRGNVETSSDNFANYEGTTIGGGTRVEKTATGYQVDMLGQRKVLTSTNKGVLFDVSISSSSPLVLNKLARSGRIISSGTLDVYHNRAKFKASHVFNNLTWSANCCYPTSGSMTITLSGSRTESGTVNFNGCGNVTSDFATTRSFTLAHCE